MSARTLYELARADFLERSRRYALFVTIALVIWFASVLTPAMGANYITVGFGSVRGIYNSAWVGATFAMMAAVLFSCPAFYLVKNAIARDSATGVGEILAASKLKTRSYLIGKFLSSWAYLSIFTITLAVAALVMQLVRGEDRTIDLWALWSPFLFITTPVFAVIAALAILFESIPPLRKTLGNVVFYFLWIAMISPSIGMRTSDAPAYLLALDMYGVGLTMQSMAEPAQPLFTDDPLAHSHIGFNIRSDNEWKKDFATFRWKGVRWTPALVLARLWWALVALGIAAFGLVFFERFDRTIALRLSPALAISVVPPRRWGERVSRWVSAPLLAPLQLFVRTKLGALTDAELRLAIQNRSVWWFVVAVGLFIAQVFVTNDLARSMILAGAWIWPLPLLSPLGNRELSSGVDRILWSAPKPLGRQLLASFLAGVFIMAFTGGGVAIQYATSGEIARLFPWFIGTLFVPALALAAGVWSSSPRLFEVLYLFIWYGGALNLVPYLDYGGFTNASAALHLPAYCFLATVGLLALAYVGRARQLRG